MDILSLSTVNVIHDVDGSINVVSYQDNPKGNKAAESYFSFLAREADSSLTDLEINDRTEDGFIEVNGEKIYIVHSNNEAELPKCPKCGSDFDKDCQGEMRCPECDPPCPSCSDGGM